ncbi:MAG: carbohydrate ABC transporter permease [Clostridia bacterium]|nr:carbohydrate ABC transporter permease [Clostridia bacterium]
MITSAAARRQTGYKRQKSTSQAIITAVLAVGSLSMVIPFLWMLATSFDAGSMYDLVIPPRFWPSEPSLSAYRIAVTNIPLFRYMFNSLTVAAGNILIAVLSAICAGYAISKIKFKGRNIVLLIALSTLMIPGEVTMTSRFYLFLKFGLTNSYFAFWLPSFAYVFGTFFAKQYMDSIPDSLRESARLDGAGELRIAMRIYMPLCGALVATLVVLLFLGTWNDFMWPLIILSRPNMYTLQLGIAMFSMNQGSSSSSQLPAVRLAITCVSIIPVLIVYLFLQRYIVESIALSGVKQ